MIIVKEAYTEHVKAVVAPDYVTLEHNPGAHGQEVLHISREEATELVEWLSHELNRVLPETLVIRPYQPRDIIEAEIVDMPRTPPKKPEIPDACAYEPGPRTATQTVEVKVGDPNLAYRASGGRTRQPGDGVAETIDLGVLAAQVGKI